MATLDSQVSTYGTGVEPLDYVQQCTLLNSAGLGVAKQAEAAVAFAENLEAHLFATLPIYREERQGTKMHYLATLAHMGMDKKQITEVLGELPSRDEYEHHMDWEDACADAERAVYNRMLRAMKHVQREWITRDEPDSVTLERRALVVFCCHAPTDQPVSLHLRSGGRVPGSDQQRASMDPLGPSAEHPPRP